MVIIIFKSVVLITVFVETVYLSIPVRIPIVRLHKHRWITGNHTSFYVVRDDDLTKRLVQVINIKKPSFKR